MGQLFDRLCQVAECNVLPADVLGRLRSVHLFEFPGRAHELLPDADFAGQNRRFIEQLFFLPYTNIAVEDTASLVLFSDETEDALGIKEPRFFLEFQLMDASRGSEYLGGGAQYEPEFEGKALATWGVLHDVHILPEEPQPPQPRSAHPLLSRIFPWFFREKPSPQNVEAKKIRLQGGVLPLGALMLSRRKRRHWSVFYHYSGDEVCQLVQASAGNALAALEEVAMYNVPSRWIVKKTHTAPHVASQVPRERFARTHERPVYLLMTLKDFSRIIRDRLGGASKVKATHGRRAHPRLLQSDRFTHMRGKWIRVRSSVVGPTKGLDAEGRYEYEVITDR
jgi:hypothetical protein